MGFLALHRPPFGRPGRQLGFTLVELLVVLAIVAVLILVASPGHNGAIVESRLDQQRLGVATGLAFARSEAVERGANIRICRNTSGACGNQISGTFEWNSGWRVVEEGSNELLRVVTKDDSSVDVRYSCGDYLAFGATGERASGGSAECAFSFADPDNPALSKSLLINSAGRVRMN